MCPFVHQITITTYTTDYNHDWKPSIVEKMSIFMQEQIQEGMDGLGG